MKKHIDRFAKKFQEYNEIADIWEIGRRVFAKNSFDGILTIMGVILGSYFGNVQNGKIIVTTGIGACIAMGVSGIWATYYTEIAERKKERHELEKLTLNDLKNTKIEKAANFAAIIIALIDGLSPFFAALFVLIPFFFVAVIGLTTAYITSLGMAFLILGFLGAFLGKISDESMLKNSARMVIAGIICIILSSALQLF